MILMICLSLLDKITINGKPNVVAFIIYWISLMMAILLDMKILASKRF